MRAPRLTVKRARDLRQRMSLPEVVLWRDLRDKNLDGSRWRRQHPIGPFILDFYCPSAKLCVEVDGADHIWSDGDDAGRTAWLNAQGVRVMRFPAADVLDDKRRPGVLGAISEALREAAADDSAVAAPSTTAFGGGPPPPLRG